MKFSSILFILSTLTFSSALPVIRSQSINELAVREGNSTSSVSPTSSGTAKLTTAINLDDLNENAATTKATSSAASSNKVTAAQVKAAVSGFANDANTVSSALNQLPGLTDKKQIASLAGKAFNAESNEDSQRAVLASAAGSAGSSSNSKIIKNTPAVLSGLKAIMNNPSTSSVTSNVATIEKARQGLPCFYFFIEL